MSEEFEVDVLRVVRTYVDDVVVGVVIGSEVTDGRETQIAAGLHADATVFVDDLLEGIGVVHVATTEPPAPVTDLLDRAVASAVIAWFAVLGTPARSVAIDGRVILPADPQARVDGVGMITVSFPTAQPLPVEQPAM